MRLSRPSVVARIASRPLSLEQAYRYIRRKNCGAIALFVGTVRNHHESRSVVTIRYTAYREMAEREFRKIAEEAMRRWKLGRVWITHRVGTLRPPEPSVLIAVSAPHRAEAFAACRFTLERVKKIPPIWKEEFYRDGKAWISE